jgi:hypothetical protein
MDDTQTTSPATQEENAQAPIAGEDAPRRQPEAPNGQSKAPSRQPEAPSGPPGFSERGRMRRRMRFLRKARELAYRDLGGLVFDLHRFGRRNDTLVLAKLETIGRIDTELRALEATLAERRPVTVLREAGVAACPRCAAIHGSDDRFCPNCGLAMDLRAERPMAGPQAAPAPTPPAPAVMPAPAPAMSPTAVHTPAPLAPSSTETPSPTPAGAGAPPPAAPPPSSTAPPVPATAAPAPATPAPTPAPSTITPDRDAGPPAGPPPSADNGPAVGKDGPSVDQPTEIIRPPVKDP